MSDSASQANPVFFNSENELRSGWRVAIFFLALQALSFLLFGLLSAIIPAIPGLREWVEAGIENRPQVEMAYAMGVERTTLLVASLAVSWVCARFLERRTLASVGYQFHTGWVKDFLLGAVLGGLGLAFAVGVGALAGTTAFARQSYGAVVLTHYFVVLFVVLLVSAAFEEVLLRGFPFQALLHNLGPIAPLAVTSLLFGLLHVPNPDATFLSTVNTVLAGVWLGVAYLKTRSLWLATGLHHAWNLVTVFVFGLPVSGLKMFDQMAILRGEPGGPVWLTGGSYGPEGGVAVTAALLLSTLLVWKSGLFRATPEMLASTRHNSLSGEAARAGGPPEERAG